MGSVILTVAILVLNVILGDCYNIGLGRADVTGPAAEIGMMGYAKQGQNTGGENIENIVLHLNHCAGVHLRQYSRAFIIEVCLSHSLLFSQHTISGLRHEGCVRLHRLRHDGPVGQAVRG